LYIYPSTAAAADCQVFYLVGNWDELIFLLFISPSVVLVMMSQLNADKHHKGKCLIVVPTAFSVIPNLD
jgi:hypothetical protein